MSVIESMLGSEESANADKITVTVTNGSSVLSVYKDKAIGSKGTVELFTKDVILVSGDSVKVTAGTANRLHVITSIIEIPKSTSA